jgi:hypothetical protein
VFETKQAVPVSGTTPAWVMLNDLEGKNMDQYVVNYCHKFLQAFYSQQEKVG